MQAAARLAIIATQADKTRKVTPIYHFITDTTSLSLGLLETEEHRYV